LLVPDAPATATATASTATTASVAFTAPSNVGGGAVTGYSVVPTTGGTVFTSASSPISVTGLTASTSYAFQVTATNAYGPGPILTSNTVTTGALSWLGNLALTGQAASGEGIVSDAAGNIYVSGYANYPAYYLGAIVKLNSAGVIQWQRFFRQTGNSTFCQFFSIAVDSSGNVYGGGYEGSNGLVVKFNSSGTLQWQKSFSSVSDNTIQDLAVDASGNVIIFGKGYNVGFVLAKLDSSGALLWQVKLGAGTTTYARGVELDASGNIYVSGHSDVPSGTGTQDFVVAKYDSSGTLQWQRYLGRGALEYQYGPGLALDSSGNVYYAGWSNDSGSSLGILAKWNNSGTFQWQRSFGTGTGNIFNACAVDSSDNIYAVGYANGNNGLIVKYDPTGAVTWQRRLYDSSAAAQQINLTSVSVRGTTLYINGFKNTVSTGSGFMMAVLPTDGSLTGTYTLTGVTLTYATTTFATAIPNLTNGTASFTATAGTATFATGTAVATVETLVATNVTL
jgi:hypothetical protein